MKQSRSDNRGLRRDPQRDDVDEVRPAWHIDPAYARALADAARAGVEVIAYAARVGPTEVALYR